MSASNAWAIDPSSKSKSGGGRPESRLGGGGGRRDGFRPSADGNVDRGGTDCGGAASASAAAPVPFAGGREDIGVCEVMTGVSVIAGLGSAATSLCATGARGTEGADAGGGLAADGDDGGAALTPVDTDGVDGGAGLTPDDSDRVDGGAGWTPDDNEGCDGGGGLTAEDTDGDDGGAGLTPGSGGIIGVAAFIGVEDFEGAGGLLRGCGRGTDGGGPGILGDEAGGPSSTACGRTAAMRVESMRTAAASVELSERE